MAKMYLLGEAGFEQATEPKIEVGQIIFLVGYGQTEHSHDRKAVYNIRKEDRFNTVYLDWVNLDKFELGVSQANTIRPIEKLFGIGTYYKQGDIASQEEINHALPIAQENQRKVDEEKERFKQEQQTRANVAAEWWIKNTPPSAKAYIIAELEENTSDGMSDYWGSKTIRTLLLAFSESERNNFKELRQAARNAKETEFLADMDYSVEHRENYTGGGGYYLGKHRYEGWKVSKQSFAFSKGDFVADPENIKLLPKEQAKVIEGSAPTGDKIATCKINNAKGGIELYFPGKPAASVLDDLKANGFRWSKFNKCWYKLDNAIARKVAAKYADIPQSLNATERIKDAQLVDAQEQAAIENGNY